MLINEESSEQVFSDVTFEVLTIIQKITRLIFVTLKLNT